MAKKRSGPKRKCEGCGTEMAAARRRCPECGLEKKAAAKPAAAPPARKKKAAAPSANGAVVEYLPDAADFIQKCGGVDAASETLALADKVMKALAK